MEEESTLVQVPGSDGTNESKIPPRLIMVGALVVAALIIIGLLLPPISLGQRLGLGGSDTADTNVSAPQSGADETAPTLPNGIALSGNETVNVSVSALSAADFLSSTPAATTPANLTVRSDVYTFNYEGDAPEGQIALALPSDVDTPQTIDLYGWTGTEWAFLPSHIDQAKGQVVSQESILPQAVALMQAAEPASITVGAEVLPTQELPVAVLPHLTEVTAGTLTLAGNGELEGEVTTAPTGPYDQLLRVTNTGLIVDQAALSELLSDTTAQAEHINILVSRATAGNFAGVNLDYQGVTAGQKESFTQFVSDLAGSLKAQNLSLAVTLGTPMKVGSNWDTGGQDWSALGQIADIVYLQMPLNPTAYSDGGPAEQLVTWATRQINRYKITMLVSADAIDGIGESFLRMPNEQALAKFGELEFVEGGEEVEPDTPVEVSLTGSASPLEWDGNSLTYKYSYEQAGQTHYIWLSNESTLHHRTRFAKRYHLRGVAVSGLGNITEAEGYANALQSLIGEAEAPQPSGAAIVWTVRDESDSVLASDSGNDMTFSWEGTENPGSYTINADFALGDRVSRLASVSLAVAAKPLEPEVVEVAEEPEATPTPSPTTPPAQSAASISPGDADAVVNTAANVRTGPGLTYSTIAGGAAAGTRVTLIGRNADSTWFNILMPDGQTEGWIFGTLLSLNPAVNVSALEVIEVEPPVIADNPAPVGPAPVAPITNSGFELGGQTHTFANPTLMSYAGMNWVKFQHKWGVGDTPDAVAGRIQHAHANGFKVLLSIPGADHSSIDYNAYVNFLGGVAALGPDAIEVWNEMNIDREWPSGQINPTTYVNNMLAPAYRAIKAANPNVMVISGAPAPTGFFGGCSGAGCDDAPYIAGMAAAGAASYMDCIGIHYNEGIISPNQTSGDPRSSHYTRYFWGMVNTYWNAFGGSRPLCFTEIGYLTGADYGGLPGGFSWAGNTTIAQHAQWLAEAASLSASSGKVRLFIVFNVDFTTYGSDPQAGYAMIRADGSCPACETLRQVTGGR